MCHPEKTTQLLVGAIDFGRLHGCFGSSAQKRGSNPGFHSLARLVTQIQG
jgi:hypothetical protein